MHWSSWPHRTQGLWNEPVADWVSRAFRTGDSIRAVALLLGVMVSTSALHAQGTAIVSGSVRDEGGAPVREALVVIDPDSLRLRARTAADGRFRIPGVPRGRYEVRVVRIGFRPHSRMIDVDRPE